jgi:hypothetical protein
MYVGGGKGMKKYRKKPVIIEAEQWFKFGDVPKAPIEKEIFSHDGGCVCKQCGEDIDIHAICKTLEGKHIVCPGDYIIRGIKGEFYPCKKDIFFATYEPV